MSQITVSDAGMRVVKLLVGNPPKTMADLIKATGVTRTAVTEQLNELVAAGLVARTVERTSGRGRPRHRYEATDAALLLLFADNRRLVVPALWKAIDEIGGEQLTKKVLKRVGKSMAEHYRRRVKGRTPRARLRQLIELLREEGGLLDVDSDGKGGLRIHKRSCPFFSMYEETQNVCVVDREMMSLVVGAKVKRTACRHEGDPCCTFELARKGKR
jgi:predicted ArsR family transcriptional regulator